MENKSKKKKYLIISIIGMILITIGVSYAYWMITRTQTGNNIVTTLNCLDTTLTDLTAAINLTKEFPVTDEEGMTYTPYSFKVTNHCDLAVDLQINLEVLIETTLAHQYIRASLNPLGDTTNNSKLMTEYTIVEETITNAVSYNLKKVYLKANSEQSYDLRVWIDKDTPMAAGMNKIINSKIVLKASPTKESAPAHLTINYPSTMSGNYISDFAGATWNAKKGMLELSSINSDVQTINLTPNNAGAVNLATYIMSLSNTQGVYNEPATDFRYEGKNPNNYVAFNDELWRIIGVFSDNTHGKSGQKLVKIIRNESIGGLVWQKNNLNDWNHATSLKVLLNEYYYNGINETTITHCYGNDTTVQANCDFTNNGITDAYYRNMIENVTWKLGGIDSMANNVGTVYTAERGTTVSSGRPLDATGYIGLMYPSDYGYSVIASPSCLRTTNLSSYSSGACAGKAWLYGQGYEWTLMPLSSSASLVWRVNYNGSLSSNSAKFGNSVRPVLYLGSGTTKIAGDGSIGNPYIIKNS